MRCSTTLALTALLTVAVSAQSSKFDVSGKWTFTVQTDAGSGTPTVTLKQDGEKLTGHYSSAQLGEADLTGTVKGNDVNFAFGVEAQGLHIDVSYSGILEGKDAMKGTIKLGDLGGGTFTAKRQ